MMLSPVSPDVNTKPNGNGEDVGNPLVDEESPARASKQKKKKSKSKKEKKNKKKNSSHRRTSTSSLPIAVSEAGNTNQLDENNILRVGGQEEGEEHLPRRHTAPVHTLPSDRVEAAAPVKPPEIDEDSFVAFVAAHRQKEQEVIGTATGNKTMTGQQGDTSKQQVTSFNAEKEAALLIQHYQNPQASSYVASHTGAATPTTEPETFVSAGADPGGVEHPAVARLREQQQAAQAGNGIIPTEFAKEQGVRFQDYLKATGQVDEALASATADAFEAFLQSTLRSGKLARSAAPASLSAAIPPPGEMAGKEIDEGCFADDVSDLGNSLMGGDWDNGTFASYTTMTKTEKLDRQQEKLAELVRYNEAAAKLRASGESEEAPGNNKATTLMTTTSLTTSTATATEGEDDCGWGEIKRNESFVRQRRTESIGLGAKSPASLPTPPPPPPPLQSQFSTRDSLASGDQISVATSTGCGSTGRAFGRTFKEQWSTLSIEQRQCVVALKKRWEQCNPDDTFADEWYLRFAKCSPGKPFTFKSAYRTMKKTNPNWLGHTLNEKLERNLLTKIVVPCPCLRTIEGYEVFYMRPSLVLPKEMPISVVNEQVAYVMNAMLEKEQACTDGIGVLCNMSGWKMKHFSLSATNTVCMHFQGLHLSPTRVSKFFIVDPPSWFGSIWAIVRPMFAKSFRRKVHMIKGSQMADYFAEGFEKALPDDMVGGEAPTEELIRTFIADRKVLEAERAAIQGSENPVPEERPGPPA
uniref:CRAL-TRIO domain-containing protein n=1 Tax=Grammatophora oceanica TaxID=210454 RepID=A0A7S1Y071_9STRA|mmetsp:Transcript_13944/g.20414  ORF Transcript_13944/g.20414 Transcript_13944/m.20414 type:complete len:751 (+) Transcript_13944:354-2606(+)